MKATAFALLALVISSAVPVVWSATSRSNFLDVNRAVRTVESDRTITKVVKLLRKMLAESKKGGR